MSPRSSATNGRDVNECLLQRTSTVAGNSPDAAELDAVERWKREIEGPFRRLDPNPDALELVRLALCAVTIVPLRVVLIGAFLPTYYVCALCFMTVAPDTMWAQSVSIYCVRMASWFLLVLLGFWKVDVKGMEENAGRRDEPRVFVANHVGYVEILYFLYELGPSFVMKRTCLRVPLIGSIAARIVDCVPVDNKGGRAGGSGAAAIAARLLRMFGAEALATGALVPPEQRQQEGEMDPSSPAGNGTATKPQPTKADANWARGWRGNPLLLFPEGTTSNGSCVLRFKTGVFAAGVPVHPVTVKYDFHRFSPAFESIYFPVHTLRALAEPAHHLRVEYLPRFDPTPEQQADRALYARAVRRVFCEALDLPAVEAGYAEKTEYHAYLRGQFRRHPWGRLALLLPSPDRHREALESRARSRRAARAGVANESVVGDEQPEVVGGRGDDGCVGCGVGEQQQELVGRAVDGAEGGVAAGAAAVAAAMTLNGSGGRCAEGEAPLRRRVMRQFVAS